MSNNIWKERLAIDKEYRDLCERLMNPYSEYFRLKRLDLMQRCAQEGHNFKFSHIGPLGHVWNYCSKCGKSEVKGECE